MRVKEFQFDTTKRKREHYIEAIRLKLEVAETAVLRLKETGAELQATQRQDSSRLPELLARARATVAEAQGAVAAARGELDRKAADLGGGRATGRRCSGRAR